MEKQGCALYMGSTNSISLKVWAKNVGAHYTQECIIHGKIRYVFIWQAIPSKVRLLALLARKPFFSYLNYFLPESSFDSPVNCRLRTLVSSLTTHTPSGTSPNNSSTYHHSPLDLPASGVAQPYGNSPPTCFTVSSPNFLHVLLPATRQLSQAQVIILLLSDKV